MMARFFKRRKRQRKYPNYRGRRQPVLESRSRKETASETKADKRYTRSPRRSGFGSFVRRTMLYAGIAGTVFMAYVWITLPDIDGLNRFLKTPSIVVKAEDGKIIGSFGDVYGDFVRFDEFPTALVDAVMATEDRNFYYHFGVDPLGLARAMWVNFQAGKVVQGGSTITQQVAKNVFLTPERSMMRKLREMILAFKLEYRFSKQDIMAIYLNRVYLGAGTYGVDAASRRYFDKSARDINLSEASILAGLLKAPSRFAPTSNPTRAKQRAEQVLINMQDAGYLSESQTKRAREQLREAMSTRKRETQGSMYFAEWVADQVSEILGTTGEDVVVITTLKPDLQDAAEKAVTSLLAKDGDKEKISQAALVSMLPDGAVVAMLGGRSYAESQFNRATQSQRQPGSAFKLFVYLAGLENGMWPDMLVEDAPITIPIPGGTWRPKNYTGRFLGEVTLREAVADSINTVAASVAQQAGVENVVDMAKRLGVNSPMIPVPSIALGSTEVTLLELTTAYAHMPSGGEVVVPRGISRIETSQGSVLYEYEPKKSAQVISTNSVNMMNDMLMAVTTSGTGRRAQIGRPIAGKTGTTSDYKDAWFIGYTAQLATGVWVGNDDNTPMKKVTGGGMPSAIWRDYMKVAMTDMATRGLSTEFSPPEQLPWQEGEAGLKPNDVKLGPEFWNKLMGQ
ncbi:MAG: PBP1A family penicillin-binding protein [Rickettsiales bacterium]|jgi:penicillin-binding protein 1A|nr:PBP1A family penicillin-binding protein [Rickettsiales bacterium]